MSYNMNLAYPYVASIQKKNLAMQRANPMWEPKLFSHDDMIGRGAQRGPHTDLHGGMANISSGRASVGFNDLSEFNTYYDKPRRGYKSSGEDGNHYFNRAELSKINAAPSASRNFTGKNSYNNVRPGGSEHPKIFKSILDIVEDDNDYGNLKMPESKPKRKAPAKKGKGREMSVEGGALFSGLDPKVKAAFKKSLTGRVGSLSGGFSLKKFNVEKFAKTAANLSVSVLQEVAKIGAPKVGAILAEQANMPPEVGKIAGKLLARALVSATNDLKFKKKKKVGGATKIGKITPTELKEMGLGDIKHPIANKTKGGKAKKPAPKKAPMLSKEDEKVLFDILMESVVGSQNVKALQGGKLNFNDKLFKKALKTTIKSGAKIAKTVGPPALKIGLPVAASAVSTSLGLSPMTGLIVGKIAGEVLNKSIYGKGVISDTMAVVKKPNLSGAGVIGGAISPQKRRAALVKKLMASEGISLPAASSMIKLRGMKY